jgi:hypothetical protein
VAHPLITRQHTLCVHLVLTVLRYVVQVDEVGVSLQIVELHLRLRGEVPAQANVRVREVAWLTKLLTH